MATPIENNTEGLQEILRIANSLPSAGSNQNYGKLVVFGDSIGEGANNNTYSFVDILEESGVFESVVKACYSGAGIGSYDTNGYDLNSQIERYTSDVRNADIIILEYGANDCNFVLNGTAMGNRSDTASATTVCGYTQKAINRIRELNSTAVIHWVNVFSKDWNKLSTFAGNDYADVYTLFLATVMKKVMDNDIYIIDISNVFATAAWLSNDGLHPNTAGQKVIANTIMTGLFRSCDIFPTERIVTLTVPNRDYSKATVNAKYAHLRKIADAGVSVRIAYAFDYNGNQSYMVYHLSYSNDYAVSFHNTAFDGVNTNAPLFTEVRVLYNDTVEIVNVYV